MDSCAQFSRFFSILIPTSAANFKNPAKKPKLLCRRRVLLPESLFVSKILQNLSVSYAHNSFSLLKNTDFFLRRMSFTAIDVT
jgi:hypothetical protein